MKAEKGSRVKVHYTGTLKNGEIFDSSKGRNPLEFVVGAGQMIRGFDKGVVGMSPGEERIMTLAPEDAYGERREDLLFQVSREALPEGYTPALGDPLKISLQDGGSLNVLVSALEETHILLDGNHRLAGEELTFAVTLVEIASH